LTGRSQVAWRHMDRGVLLVRRNNRMIVL